MKLRLIADKYRHAIIESRTSPISRPAIFLALALFAIGLVASIATKFSFATLPNIMPLVVLVVIVDLMSRLAPRTKVVEAVQTIVYGVLYLVIVALCAIVAAYATQRLALPLQDHLFARADRALGLDWSSFVHWVDHHRALQTAFKLAYATLSWQIALPLIVLAFANRLNEVRAYLLAFTIALSTTIVISALLPAGGPIVFVDRASFDVMRFTGATPIDHLMRLREAGPLVLSDAPGGIATFPSFHATIAVLTPLALRSYRPIFIALVVLDAAMLGGTLTEGAHYFIDVLAGTGMAFFAYALARRIISRPSATHAGCAISAIARPAA